MQPRVPDRDRAWRADALAWAFYDFAYSGFVFLFAVRFFPPWIIDDLGRPDWYVGMTLFVSVLVALVGMPIAGVLADQFGRRKPFLFAFTAAACGACAALSLLPTTPTILPVLVVAGVTIFFGQLAFAQFDPLLADVATDESRGRVSGLAVTLGFIGILFGLVVVGQLIVGDGSKQRAFLPAGTLYLTFALPAFFLVQEHRQQIRSPPAKLILRGLVATFTQARRHRAAWRFVLGRFLYSDAIVTMGTFLTVYMTRIGDFSEEEKNLAVGIGVVAAALGAISAGRLVEKLGPKAPLLAVLPAFAFTLLISALIGQAWTVWLAAPVAGVALGFVWTADRVFMLILAPAAMRGQFFAFFNLANRVASALGPLVVWSGTVWLLHERTGWLSVLGASRAAVGCLAAIALVGWTVIRGVAERTPPADAPDAILQRV